jgi:DNA-binding NtrC family response regulator
MARVLVIEEQAECRDVLEKSLNDRHRAAMCSSHEDGIRSLAKDSFDVIVLDLQNGYSLDMSAVRKFREKAPETPLIVTSSNEQPQVIISAMKAGAFDFIVKPCTPDKIIIAIDHALEKSSLRNEIDYLRHQQDVIYDFDRIVAVSPAMQKVIATIKKLVNTDSTILMTGETGTGKSFLSGALHFNSLRKNKSFTKINCTNIPETLLESELFGHAKGAFTGADKQRMGRLEQANGGTVFLDEIGELTPALQAKLLRVLDDKCFERLGDNRTIYTDIRIVSATYRNLEELVAEKKFREDLYYRINVLNIHLPPLRDRLECIEPLSNFLLKRICRSGIKKLEGFAPAVINIFKHYTWPGNIRELSNIIERAVFLEEGSIIGPDSIFLPLLPQAPAHAAQTADTCPQLDAHEKNLIIEILDKCLWVQKDAAVLLGLTPRALHYKITKYGIKHHRWYKNKL